MFEISKKLHAITITFVFQHLCKLIGTGKMLHAISCLLLGADQLHETILSSLPLIIKLLSL